MGNLRYPGIPNVGKMLSLIALFESDSGFSLTISFAFFKHFIVLITQSYNAFVFVSDFIP